MYQTEFEFDVPVSQHVRTIHTINERLEQCEDTSLEPWYRTNKYGDWLLDNIVYGWRIYNRYYDVKSWIISTYQRIRYGVADRECWSLDSTFTNFILPRLKHFKKMTRYTYPNDITPEKWEEILDEIIWAFEFMNDDSKFLTLPQTDDDGNFNGFLNRQKTDDEKAAWKDYFEKSKILNKRKQKALELFGKYYEALWD